MSAKRFSTFEGVFTPCLLSILGVIMYLRLGWVVGQAGWLGTLAIIILANAITLLTALSMSSVVTNIRIGAGGAYSIITKSLGVEAGGAIGLPLFICQAFSVAFYITGFSECWQFIFPLHNPLLVNILLWAALFSITLISASLGFRLQYIIMGFIGLSIFSMAVGNPIVSQIPAGMALESVSFWGAFAIFFPAVTGILAGATMSGELTDPRKSIPLGTLSAIGVSFIIYIFLAFLFARNVDSYTLKTNLHVAIELGRWPSLVIAGIMGATISSALSMFIGAPRVLMALSKHRIIPFGPVFNRLSKRGEPSAAILLTALVSLVPILFGSLNQIASLLTMFFLITYGMINLSVFIEESIGIVSFRPTFRVNRFVPFLGSIGCVLCMFLIDPKFSLTAIVVILFVYIFLIQKGIKTYSPDIRSGLLLFLAEQFAKAASRLPYYPKIWKPNLVVPLNQLSQLHDNLSLITAIVAPAGRVNICYFPSERPKKISTVNAQLTEIVKPLRHQNIYVEPVAVESPQFVSGVKTVIQTLRGSFFPPNTLFYVLNGQDDQESVAQMITDASMEELGIIILDRHPKIGFSQEKIINLWIRQQSPNINLSVLVALQLQRNWEGQVRIISVVPYENDKGDTEKYLLKLKDLMRMPPSVETVVLVGPFNDVVKRAPTADLNIFGMQEKIDIPMMRGIARNIQTSSLFLKDSHHESAVA